MEEKNKGEYNGSIVTLQPKINVVQLSVGYPSKINMKLTFPVLIHTMLICFLGSSMANKELLFKILVQDPFSPSPTWHRSTSATIRVWLPTSWAQPTRACLLIVSNTVPLRCAWGLLALIHQQKQKLGMQYVPNRTQPLLTQILI